MKVVAALVVSLATALAGAGPALAIDNGVPDGDAHPNVGLLAFDVDGEGDTPPFALCTGSVISDSVFLTAAHCITAIPDVQWVVTLEGGGPGDPVESTGFFPDDFPFALTVPVYRSIGAVVHPDFGGGRHARTTWPSSCSLRAHSITSRRSSYRQPGCSTTSQPKADSTAATSPWSATAPMPTSGRRATSPAATARRRRRRFRP